VLNYVGAYFLKLDGHVDALVFSGGIGERSKELRSTVGERVRCLGFSGVDGKKNEGVDVEHGVVVDIDQNADGARGKRILVCRTDEQAGPSSVYQVRWILTDLQLEMARQCALENKFWEE
jgi:acetate kinase